MSNILDFTDYAKAIEFKFNENDVYRIPALNKMQVETILSVNKKYVDMAKNADEENIEGNISVLGMQDEQIALVVEKKTQEGGWIKIDPNELASWPIGLKTVVMQKIGEQMSTSVGGNSEVEKKS